MAVDLGSTFKELIDEINSKSSGAAIDSIDGLKGGTLSSPLTFTGGDGTNAKKAILDNTNNGQITDKSTGTLLGFIGRDFIVGSNSYLTKIRGNAYSTIAGKKFSDLAVKSDIPNTSDFVKLSGDNTFTGTNIFSNLLSVGGSTGGTAIGMGALINVVGPEEMYTLNLPKQNGTLAIDGDYVKLTTDQTISGIKTFTSGSIVVSKTDSSNKTMKVAYGCNGIAYTPYGTTSIKLISFPAKDGTLAVTDDIDIKAANDNVFTGTQNTFKRVISSGNTDNTCKIEVNPVKGIYTYPANSDNFVAYTASGVKVKNATGTVTYEFPRGSGSDYKYIATTKDLNNYVNLAGKQTISGAKTFTGDTTVDGGTFKVSKTDSANKTVSAVYGPNAITYTPYGSTSQKLISLPSSNGTIALTKDIPSINNLVTTNTDQTITGIKTFNAPTDVSGQETITTKFKTSNGGSITIGKEGSNSGTMLRFDQVDGTCRLRFRGSATAGAMVWSQPEKNAVLYFDMGNSAGSGVNRVTLRNVAGTLALTKELPAAVSANPTLSGSETELTGLQIGSTKYKIPSGGGGGGGCTLDDLEAVYKEDIENGDIDNVNAIPVLDVENTGYWTMVPVSELGGGSGGSEKKYYNHYVKITEPGTYGSGKKEIILNIVSTSDAAFTKNNIYLHLKSYQLCICNFTEYPSLTVKTYSAYIVSCTTSQLIVSLIGGDTLSPSLSSVEVADIVTLISDL